MESIDGTLVEALTSDLPSVVAAYEAVRTLTTLLKTEYVTALELNLPARVAGDAD